MIVRALRNCCRRAFYMAKNSEAMANDSEVIANDSKAIARCYESYDMLRSYTTEYDTVRDDATVSDRIKIHASTMQI